VDTHTRTTKWTARRVAYTLAIGFVAAVAAWNSYWHMYDVALLGHQAMWLAATLPLSVDGMLLVATLAMAEDKANGRKARGWARFAFWLGAVVSVCANVASTMVHHGMDPLSIAVAAWPPLALLVVVEIMARPGKPIKDPVRVEAGRKGARSRQAARQNGAAKQPPRRGRRRTPPTPRPAQVADARIGLATAPVSPAV